MAQPFTTAAMHPANYALSDEEKAALIFPQFDATPTPEAEAFLARLHQQDVARLAAFRKHYQDKADAEAAIQYRDAVRMCWPVMGIVILAIAVILAAVYGTAAYAYT